MTHSNTTEGHRCDSDLDCMSKHPMLMDVRIHIAEFVSIPSKISRSGMAVLSVSCRYRLESSCLEARAECATKYVLSGVLRRRPNLGHHLRSGGLVLTDLIC